MRKLLILLALAACGSKTKFPSDDRADRVVIDCPTGHALDRAADAAWGTTEDGEHVVTCTPLYNREPLWLLDGAVFTEAGVTLGTALTTTQNELRWKDVVSIEQAEYDLMTGDGFTAVDLDGDAHDELLRVAGEVTDHQSERWLDVFAIVDGKAVKGETFPLSTGACEVQHEVINAPRGRHLVQVTFGASCEKPGTKVYGWDGQQLVEE